MFLSLFGLVESEAFVGSAEVALRSGNVIAFKGSFLILRIPIMSSAVFFVKFASAVRWVCDGDVDPFISGWGEFICKYEVQCPLELLFPNMCSYIVNLEGNK